MVLHGMAAHDTVAPELRGFKRRASHVLESLTNDEEALSKFVSVAHQEIDDIMQVTAF